MEGLLTKAGKIRFLFADEGPYYLDSLVKLPLRSFLLYQLRQNGYEQVFFYDHRSESGNEMYCVEMYDESSVQSYGVQPKKKGLLAKIVWGEADDFEPAPEGRKGGTAVHYSPQAAALPALKLFEKKDAAKCAFIIPISVFAEIFSDQTVQTRLVQVLGKPFPNKLIILTGSRDTSEWLPCLTAGDNIYSTEVFPKLRFMSKVDMRLDTFMRTYLADCFYVWNASSPKNAAALITRKLLEGRGEKVYEPENIPIYTQILTVLLYSGYKSRAREQARAILPECPDNLSGEKLVAYMTGAEVLKQMDDKIRQMRSAGIDPAKALGAGRSLLFYKTVFLPQQTALARKVLGIDLKEVSDQSGQETDVLEKQLEELYLVLDLPRTGGENQKVNEAAEYILQELSYGEAVYASDRHVSDVMALFRFLAADEERAGSLFGQKLEYLLTMARMSARIEKEEETEKQVLSQLEEVVHESDALMNKLKSRNGWEQTIELIRHYVKEEREDYDVLSPLKSDTEVYQLITLQRQKKGLDDILREVRSRLTGYREGRTKLQQTIDSMGVTGFADVVADAAELMKQLSEKKTAGNAVMNKALREIDERYSTNEDIKDVAKELVDIF